MQFEQILIRLGVDATAVSSGLNRVSNYVKAWGSNLVEDLKGSFLRLFAAGAAVEGLNKIREKISEIKTLAEETGTNTNFIQGLMQEAAKSGEDVEVLASGITRFNKLIGAAKSGAVSAIIQLKDMHVVTDKNSISTLNFTNAMHNLSIRFEELNDKQKQAYLLSQAFGKSYAALTPIFERGNIDALNSGNYFTKIRPDTIGSFQTEYRSIVNFLNSAGATTANFIGSLYIGTRNWINAIARLGELIHGPAAYSKAVTQDYLDFTQQNQKSEEKVTHEKMIQAEADREGISAAELKTKILNEQSDLLEKQSDLTATIADRDKESVSEMASQARKILGIKSPLERFHTVTPRMRMALRIDDLEDRAKIEGLRGNDAIASRYQSEADRIRASSPWLKRQDQNPMAKTESELSRVNQQLAPVAEMAKLVTNDNK